jgi:hypothetical protein
VFAILIAVLLYRPWGIFGQRGSQCGEPAAGTRIAVALAVLVAAAARRSWPVSTCSPP